MRARCRDCPARRFHQRRFARRQSRIGIGSRRQQLHRYGRVSVRRSGIKRRCAVFVGALRVGARGQQQVRSSPRRCGRPPRSARRCLALRRHPPWRGRSTATVGRRCFHASLLAPTTDWEFPQMRRTSEEWQAQYTCEKSCPDAHGRSPAWAVSFGSVRLPCEVAGPKPGDDGQMDNNRPRVSERLPRRLCVRCLCSR